jgi:hypothetical protein
LLPKKRLNRKQLLLLVVSLNTIRSDSIQVISFTLSKKQNNNNNKMPPVKKDPLEKNKSTKKKKKKQDEEAPKPKSKKRKAEAVAAGQAYFLQRQQRKQQIELQRQQQQFEGITATTRKKQGGTTTSRKTATPKRQSRTAESIGNKPKKEEEVVVEYATSEEEEEEEKERNEEQASPNSTSSSTNQSPPNKRRRIVESPPPTVATATVNMVPTYPQAQAQQPVHPHTSTTTTATTEKTNVIPPSSPQNQPPVWTKKPSPTGMKMNQKPPFGSPMPESRFRSTRYGSSTSSAVSSTTIPSQRKQPSSFSQNPQYSGRSTTFATSSTNHPHSSKPPIATTAAATVHWEDSQIDRDETLDYGDQQQEDDEVDADWILFSSKPSSAKREGTNRIRGCLWTLLAILWMIASAMVGIKLAPPESLEFLHFAIPTSSDEISTAASSPSPASSSIPCYTNSQTEEDDDHNAVVSCPNPELADRTIHPCPEFAICVNGILESCIGKYHILNPEGTACVLSPQSQSIFPMIQKELERLSAKEVCHPSSSRRTAITSKNYPMFHAESGRPMFPFEQVIQPVIGMMNGDKNGHDLDDTAQSWWNLLQWMDQTENSGENGQLFILEESVHPSDSNILLRSIGLHPSQPIPIPIVCRAKKMLIWTLSTVLALIGTVSSIILTWLWQWFWDSPNEFLATCTIGAITLQAICYVRSKRRAQRQLELDVLRMRQRVYQELSRTANTNNNPTTNGSSTSAVLANMILNRIVWEWFPLNRAERQRWSVRVWPLVVRDIESDDRIHKSYTDSGGNTPQLVWQWLDHPILSTASVGPETAAATTTESNTGKAAVSFDHQKNGNQFWIRPKQQQQQNQSQSHEMNHRQTWSGN